MYHRQIARFEICNSCGRKIRLTRHGLFRRHIFPKGVVCAGSWARPTLVAGDGASRPLTGRNGKPTNILADGSRQEPPRS
jgi:hypothetical protein